MTSPPTETEKSRFKAHIRVSGACWIWTGAYHNSAPITFCDGFRRYRSARRVSFVLANGREPESKIRPACGDNRCVSPEHLRVGPKPRPPRPAHPPRGEDNPATKLTIADVAAIRATYQRGERGFGYHVLAQRHGVARGTIKAVITRRTWKHVRETEDSR